MYGDMCEFPEFCDVKEISKSRKDHKCCECGDVILKGSPYVYISGKWDGEIDSFHQHQECAEACRSVRDDYGNGCIAFGYYLEWLQEEFCARNQWWSKRMRKALAVLIKKHPKIREDVKDYVIENEDWSLVKKPKPMAYQRY